MLRDLSWLGAPKHEFRWYHVWCAPTIETRLPDTSRLRPTTNLISPLQARTFMWSQAIWQKGKKRRNIATTGKPNTHTRRGQTRRGKDGSLGTIFNGKILKDCWESPGAAQTCFLCTPASFCFSQLASWLDTFRSRPLFTESWLRSRQLSPHTKIFWE